MTFPEIQDTFNTGGMGIYSIMAPGNRAAEMLLATFNERIDEVHGQNRLLRKTVSEIDAALDEAEALRNRLRQGWSRDVPEEEPYEPFEESTSYREPARRQTPLKLSWLARLQKWWRRPRPYNG